jgi:hypothetical protein
MSYQLHAPAALHPEKEYALSRGLGGAQNQFRRRRKEKKLVPVLLHYWHLWRITNWEAGTSRRF